MIVVTVIMPIHNGARYLDKAIKSVIAQSFSDWELIVVDDGSVDETVALVSKYVVRDARIKLIKLTGNNGAAVARNAAIRMARGRYISFLDADDRWLPKKLERQLSFIKDRKAAFVYSAYCCVNEAGRNVGVVGVPDTVTYNELLKTCYIGCLTAMYDTEILGKVEMPLIRKRQDLGLWLRLLKMIPVAYGQQEILAIYTLRSQSISSNKYSAAIYQWKLYRNIEKLHLIAAGYYFMNYVFRGVLRKYTPGLAQKFGVLHKLKN